MMRISREEELFIGRARPGLLRASRPGSAPTAASPPSICSSSRTTARTRSSGITTRQRASARSPTSPRRCGSAASRCSPTRRPAPTSDRPAACSRTQSWSRSSRRRRGRCRSIRSDIHRINAPAGKAEFGPPTRRDERSHVTSAFVREALDKGAAAFDWAARKARSGQRRGAKVTRRRGRGQPLHRRLLDRLRRAAHDSPGWQALRAVRDRQPRHSLRDGHRAARRRRARACRGSAWRCVFGSTAQHVPWTCTSDGSQTTQAMTRANHAAAMDAKRKLQAIAARDLGGRPEDYALSGGRVFARTPSRGLDVADGARRAIALGGEFDGHELPADIHAMTKASATALAGLGVMGVAKDTYPHDGRTHSYVVGFAEVEVDVETGAVRLVEYTAIARRRPVVNPRSLSGQVLGGGCMGIGHALTQRWTFDPHYGMPRHAALPSRAAADDPRRAAGWPARRGARHSRSGRAGRRARRRRAAGRRRLRRGACGHRRRDRLRDVPAHAGHARSRRLGDRGRGSACTRR